MTESGQDQDRTVVSSQRAADVPAKKRSPWLWVGLGGCAVLICLVAVVVVVVLTFRGGDGGKGFEISNLLGEKATPTIEPTSTRKPTPTEEKEEPTDTPEPTSTPTPAPPPTVTPTPLGAGGLQPAQPEESPTPTPSSEALEPVIGPITFAADVTDDNEPVEPGITFPTELEEIHAIFEYEGLSEDVIWERHWFQGETEVGTGSGPWDAGESGTFDLSLTGDGEPLGSGTWKLEIYVNGELARTGTFIIEEEEAPPAPPPPRVRKIAFSRWDGGKHNMYIANTDGSGEQFILERAAGPSWSDDGQYLSFFGEEGVDRQVRDGVEYVMPGVSNGILWVRVANFPSDITQVEMGQFQKEGSARWAAWAPSGDMIAYDAAPGGPDRRVYFLGTADNRQFDIEIPGEQGDWSPDSNQIVYRSGRDGKQGIWISNRDDSGAHNITNDGSDSFPAWSDNGQKIAFHRDSGDNVDIYIMNVDGSNIQRLTDAPGPDTLPTWTPDGQIVFRSARGGSWNIWIMNADGGGQKQIIAGADPGPDWAFGRMDVR